MYMFFEPTMILLIPALLFAVWAQHKVKSTYAKFSQVNARSGLSGADVARAILRDENIELVSEQDDIPSDSVGLTAIPGELSDHYDPKARMLRLSEGIYHGTSVAALGIAAHEVGHAVQHARMYSPLMMRNVVYPVCNIGSSLAFPLFFVGFIFATPMLMKFAIIMFTLAVFFTLITLPVEFDASARAMRALSSGGYLTEDELKGTKKVLTAAALTYVAAAAMAIIQLVRMVILATHRN
jgi:hypothetical protein